MDEDPSIAKLEAILNEFYHQSTSNFRKKEIERDLRSFQDHDESWNILINNLGSSGFNNQYLWFFSVSTIEVSSELSPAEEFLTFSIDAAHDYEKME